MFSSISSFNISPSDAFMTHLYQWECKIHKGKCKHTHTQSHTYTSARRSFCHILSYSGKKRCKISQSQTSAITQCKYTMPFTNAPHSTVIRDLDLASGKAIQSETSTYYTQNVIYINSGSCGRTCASMGNNYLSLLPEISQY